MCKNHILQKAIALASLMPNDKYRLVAIITNKRGEILSVGHNSFTKSHPLQAYYAIRVGTEKRIFIHAELDAITKIPFNSKPHAIYIVRVNKKNKPCLSKPCNICQQAIKDVGIKNIYYTE